MRTPLTWRMCGSLNPGGVKLVVVLIGPSGARSARESCGYGEGYSAYRVTDGERVPMSKGMDPEKGLDTCRDGEE